jgi:uncharacterized protein (DUF1800 family)
MRKTANFSLALFLFVCFSILAVSKPAELTETQRAIHVLNRLGFGPRPGDVERVRQTGIDRFIEAQLYPERIDDSAMDIRLGAFPSLRMKPADIIERYPDQQQIIRTLGIDPKRSDQATVRQQVQAYMREKGLHPPQNVMQELMAQRILRAVFSERQLQEVLTDFWYNHFNVFAGKTDDRFLTTEYEMRAIRPHVLGKFKDLLMATAKSSAMMVYLDNESSVAPSTQPKGNNQRAPGINENYARELMELHTMGVDGGYTQRDIGEVARAFTGWSVANEQQQKNAAQTMNTMIGQAAGIAQGPMGAAQVLANRVANQRNQQIPSNARRGDFVFRPVTHDSGEKTILGKKLKGGRGIEDGEQVIDILVHHPSTAKFIATKLVRRFVNDTPPAALVNRVAATFTRTDGDIREMLRVIFTSDEFYAPENFQAKAKSPLELTASALRAMRGVTDGGQPIVQALERMGQPIYRYQAPTGFPDRTDFWMTNGLVLERINFAIALTANQIPGTQVNLQGFSDAKAAALYIGSPDFQKR